MFKRKYPNLTKPIKLGNVEFRNRMFSAPIGGTDITADCSVGHRTIGFYELRAKGGAAAVTVKAETVICAVGQRPNSEVADLFLDSAPYVRKIGDCLNTSTIMNAIYNGYHAALDI